MGAGTMIRDLDVQILIEFDNFPVRLHRPHVGVYEKDFQFVVAFLPEFKSDLGQHAAGNLRGKSFRSERVKNSQQAQVGPVKSGGVAKGEHFNLHKADGEAENKPRQAGKDRFFGLLATSVSTFTGPTRSRRKPPRLLKKV
jgi:hypothetical protein